MWICVLALQTFDLQQKGIGDNRKDGAESKWSDCAMSINSTQILYRKQEPVPGLTCPTGLKARELEDWCHA
jgi:hypothetical protein